MTFIRLQKRMNVNSYIYFILALYISLPSIFYIFQNNINSILSRSTCWVFVQFVSMVTKFVIWIHPILGHQIEMIFGNEHGIYHLCMKTNSFWCKCISKVWYVQKQEQNTLCYLNLLLFVTTVFWNCNITQI